MCFFDGENISFDSSLVIYIYIYKYRGAGKSLVRPTSRCVLFDSENISFDDSLVIYIHIYIYVYINTGVLISPLLDLLPDVFCLMVRIFRLILVLLYIYI